MKDPSFLATYDVRVNVPLAPYVAVGTGGNADFLVEVTKPRHLINVLQAADDNGLRVALLGQGSATVFSDYGWRGIVIVNRVSGWKIVDDGLVEVQSGMPISQLVQELGDEGWGGFESLAAVPASVGGLLVRNQPVFGSMPSRHIAAVKVYAGGQVLTLKSADIDWDNRPNRLARGKEFVLSAQFHAMPRTAEERTRAQLEVTRQRLSQFPATSQAIQMFYDDDDRLAADVVVAANAAGERVGDAVISSKNANFLINSGGATSADLYELAQRVKHRASVHHNTKLRELITWRGQW